MVGLYCWRELEFPVNRTDTLSVPIVSLSGSHLYHHFSHADSLPTSHKDWLMENDSKLKPLTIGWFSCRLSNISQILLSPRVIFFKLSPRLLVFVKFRIKAIFKWANAKLHLFYHKISNPYLMIMTYMYLCHKHCHYTVSIVWVINKTFISDNSPPSNGVSC